MLLLSSSAYLISGLQSLAALESVVPSQRVVLPHQYKFTARVAPFRISSERTPGGC